MKTITRKPLRNFQRILSIAFLLILLIAMTGCTDKKQSSKLTGDKVIEVNGAKESLRIVSGSENKILEPILQQFAESKKINLAIDYQGSLDIMRLLDQDQIPFDAVWPASSLWVSVGDTRHRIKSLQSTSMTPVVFGIRKSLAQDLGFIGKEVSVKEILSAIESGKLKFTMTSATQSNSGASAYIGFVYALLGNPDVLTVADFDKPELKADLTKLLSGVERSPGSSDWLKDLFLAGDYDAMVNYEALIISANETLVAEGREPLYVVYPTDGLMIADSPLGFISQNGESGRDEDASQKAFQALQDYLLSAEVQKEIQHTGRRTGYSGIDPSNASVFNKDWGIDTDRILSTINMPKAEVLFKALNAYQSEFKKPGYNIFCLDFSGSMRGKGYDQLMTALEQVMIQSNASQNFLQASDNEVNHFLLFNNQVIRDVKATGSQALEALYPTIKNTVPNNGTMLYGTAIQALEQIKQVDLNYYSPSIILMTDGKNNGREDYSDFRVAYQNSGLDVPVFSILFGDADEGELGDLATLTKARVFDGRKNLIDAFKTVRGYN